MVDGSASLVIPSENRHILNSVHCVPIKTGVLSHKHPAGAEIPISPAEKETHRNPYGSPLYFENFRLYPTPLSGRVLQGESNRLPLSCCPGKGPPAFLNISTGKYPGQPFQFQGTVLSNSTNAGWTICQERRTT